MTSASPGRPSRSSEPASPRTSRTKFLALGLLLSFLGLVLVAVLLPTAPASLRTVLPVAAAGLVLLWTGGILLGRGSRS